MDAEEIEFTDEDLILYFKALAIIANADGKLDAEEVNYFNAQLDEFEVSTRVKKAAKLALVDPPSFDEIEAELKDSNVKYVLYTDCIVMAFADGVVTVEEESALQHLAERLGITDEQAEAIRNFVELARQAEAAEGKAAKQAKRATSEAAASLAAVGVPLGAVAVGGKVAGLSAAGITSGLAALGLGLGMASGIGVAVGLGVASYAGVKYLFSD